MVFTDTYVNFRTELFFFFFFFVTLTNKIISSERLAQIINKITDSITLNLSDVHEFPLIDSISASSVIIALHTSEVSQSSELPRAAFKEFSK